MTSEAAEPAVPAPLPTVRADLLARAASGQRWDLLVVGGGATGLGVALDAALRGYSVAVLEAHDFASGTSSRATKLAHGGVRYLAQGNIHLVREALHERQHILQAAPHLAGPLAFVMPAYRSWETPFYGTGLKLYGLLAGSASLGATRWLGARRTRELLPGVQTRGLKGGVEYWDAQFDDARLALALARTAAVHGALALNYCEVTELLHEDGRVAGVRARDLPSGRELKMRAGCIINATGVWTDRLRAQDAQAAGRPCKPMVEASQGVHLVVDADFLPGAHALLVPSTRDGRVLFAVPWLGKLILGTTDTLRDDAPHEPRPLPGEVDFILTEAARYLQRAPTRADVRSSWAGLRPLVRPGNADAQTKSVSREHEIRVADTGLVSVAGGKWTTYRVMAADVLSSCQRAGLLPVRGAERTAGLPLVGATPGMLPGDLTQPPDSRHYGSEAAVLQRLPGAQNWLAPGLSEAMVRFAARHEYAWTVQDVLARRSRLLFLDAAAAATAAPAVAGILQQELGHDGEPAAFLQLAHDYGRLPPPAV